MGKIRLWTRQDERVLYEIEKSGVYRVKREHIFKKFEDCSEVFFHVYEWYSKNAGKIVPVPEGVEFPIWLSTDEKHSLGPVAGQVLLEIEVDRSQVIIMDAAKWDHILNFWYIPKDKDDLKRHRQKLREHNVHNQTLMYMNNFHPILKREVEKSWERLFDPDIKLSEITQATVWEIRKEWIKKIIRA